MSMWMSFCRTGIFEVTFFTMCCIFSICFLQMRIQNQRSSSCMSDLNSIMNSFLVPKSLSQGIPQPRQFIQWLFWGQPTSHPWSHQLCLFQASLCTAIRLISLKHKKWCCQIKWFVCCCFSFLKWCGTGSGVILSKGWQRGVCDGQ